MKASDYVIQFLARQGVHHVFQVIGGAIAHLVDSMIDCPDVLCVTMHHEQGAAFAAEGYARCNGKLGVAMATSGPGATNLITGIGSCYFDSVPTLFITGQVNTYEYKFDKPVRQVGFQETDIVSIIKPITKGAKLVAHARDLPKELAWAVQLAQSGRPGPVLLDIPMDVQRTDIDVSDGDFIVEPLKNTHKISPPLLQEICHRLSHAKRPLILAGGGIRAGQASKELFELVEETNIPVVASLLGIDALPHTHKAYVGMIGAYGNRYANLTVANTDFLLVLGSRLDTRQTGTRPESFARGATIVHVDIDKHELNRAVQADYVVEADVKEFLQELLIELKKYPLQFPTDWQQHINHYKKSFPSFPLENNPSIIDANEFLYLLSQEVADDAIIVLDVGQHQMWASQSFAIKPKQRLINSGGMGAMGFALPVAIGAAFMAPEREIIVITGDGGLQMNIQEFQTIVRNNLPIKIVLMNNKSLGMVRQFQQLYFRGRVEGTVNGYDCPDFIKVTEAYNIRANSISTKAEMKHAITELLNKKSASLLEVLLPQNTKVDPKLVVNHPVEDQHPQLSREELAKLMLIPMMDDITA